MDDQTATADTLLDRAIDNIREHRLLDALQKLDEAIRLDFEHTSILTSLKSVKFWADRFQQVENSTHAFERGEFLLAQWPQFEAFRSRAGNHEPCTQALRIHVFGSALAAFESLLRESDSGDPELLVRIGRCHKGLGAYDEAVRYFEAAAAEAASSAEITAELADAYALVNDVSAAKAFFREAFFLDPQRVHLEVLESQMARALIRKVEEFDYDEAEVREWIPVFGVLYGVFNIKRELRSIEYGKLKQSIYALERELKEGRSRRELVEPRLINHYFWLIDHYVTTAEESSRIDEVLLKLRSVNDKIYRMYTN